MNSNEDERESIITEAVIGAALEVSNVPGSGFLEKIYERAMVRELTLRGIGVGAQRTFRVLYKERAVGEYAADLVVEGKVIVELKCVDRLGKEHLAQCLN